MLAVRPTGKSPNWSPKAVRMDLKFEGLNLMAVTTKCVPFADGAVMGAVRFNDTTNLTYP